MTLSLAHGRWLVWLAGVALAAWLGGSGLGGAGLGVASADAQEQEHSSFLGDPVEAAGAALRDGRSDYDWYDAAADDVRPVDLADGIVSARSSVDAWSWMQIGAWTLLAILLVMLLFALVRYFAVHTHVSPPPDEDVRHRPATVAQLEALPVGVVSGPLDLLAEARKWQQAGDYSQAIVYLYSHFLLELDRRQRIRLARGKTNRQYLRELRPHLALATTMEPVMRAFEDVFFGKHDLSRERYEACWSSVNSLPPHTEIVR